MQTLNELGQVLTLLIIWELRDLTRIVKEKDSEDTPDSIQEIMFGSSGIYNNALAAHLSERLAQKAAVIPANDFELDVTPEVFKELLDEAWSVDTKKALDNLEVIGLTDDLPFEYSEVHLKIFLLKFIPPLALRAIKRIEFRAFTVDEDQDYNLLGHHRSFADGNTITISNEQVWRGADRYYLAYNDDYESLTARFSMDETITHEAAHSLHGELPIAFLKMWDDRFADDGVFITSYVRKCYQEEHPNRYKEDFANSLELYTMLPDALKDSSQARYEYMDQIIKLFK